MFFGDFSYRMNNRYFSISRESFNVASCYFVGLFKIFFYSLQYRPLYCSDDHRINIEKAAGTTYTERKSGVCTINFAHPDALSLSGKYRVEKSSYMYGSYGGLAFRWMPKYRAELTTWLYSGYSCCLDLLYARKITLISYRSTRHFSTSVSRLSQASFSL